MSDDTNADVKKKRGRKKKIEIDTGDLLLSHNGANDVPVAVKPDQLVKEFEPFGVRAHEFPSTPSVIANTTRGVKSLTFANVPYGSGSLQSNIQIVIEENDATDRTITNETHCPNGSNSAQSTSEQNIPIENVLKKRGRKPKGGKLITKNAENVIKYTPVANVILHLKCSLLDLDEYNNTMNKLMTNPLDYNPDVPPNIMTYNTNEQNSTFSVYENESRTETKNSNDKNYAYAENVVVKPNLSSSQLCAVCSSNINESGKIQIADDNDTVNMKEVNSKLKKLKINLYKNSMSDKKSACFWCTYEFDNQTCYIPKYEMDGEICSYGSFCRPECAVAFLMKENIDDSTKFERYHLLNQIYSKVYDYKKNIKPAPNPYYLLDKFYGKLTIQEYRKLLKTEHMLLVIDKPLTRILPELHEDTDEFILNIYGTNTKTGVNGPTSGLGSGATQAGGVYKVKRQSEKQQGPSKSSIMRDKFGFSQ